MQTKNLWRLFALLTVIAMILSACGPAATQAPPTPAETEAAAPAPTTAAEEVGGFQIPEIEQGKFNVAMVLIGPHDDGGWSQAHYEGLVYVQDKVPNVHVAISRTCLKAPTQNRCSAAWLARVST